ncbi:oxidoreductase FAD-binding region precursor [Vibrio ishigakensis]|uniref:Oxidoreductase FAD-binding region n=1 Tax=Vibrio ishigakensis TaxID=1481914 RepID=A0A0B8P5X4_9VIBR|nr:oxidoreductase FAD-binding region precursor [Vibrio ishigakensis]
MKKVMLGFWIVVLGLSLLWFLSLLTGEQTFSQLLGAKALMQFTGYMAICLMAIVMVLSLRLQRVDNLLGGLDRSYRLHKWLAIAALVFSVIHFFWKDIAGLLASLGVYTAEPKREGAVKLHDQGREIAEQADRFLYHCYLNRRCAHQVRSISLVQKSTQSHLSGVYCFGLPLHQIVW